MPIFIILKHPWQLLFIISNISDVGDETESDVVDITGSEVWDIAGSDVGDDISESNFFLDDVLKVRW